MLEYLHIRLKSVELFEQVTHATARYFILFFNIFLSIMIVGTKNFAGLKTACAEKYFSGPDTPFYALIGMLSVFLNIVLRILIWKEKTKLRKNELERIKSYPLGHCVTQQWLPL